MDSPTADPPLPSEILEDIFLRLDDAADLARASAACTSFGRLISAPRFLRRFRSLHRPPILGCLAIEYPKFYPVDPPHRSAAAADALAQAADFDFSFINPRNDLQVRDVRDSRVLLSTRYYIPESFEYLVVCDPLHRRYATVPCIPDDLRSTSQCRGLRPIEFEPFLDPASEKEKEDEEDLPFRVICNVMYKSMIVTVVFSSVTGKWQSATSFCYGDKVAHDRHHAHNCFYWTQVTRTDMLVLDPREMMFSLVNLPPRIHHGSDIADNERAIVEAGEGRLGLLALGSDEKSLEFYLKTIGNNGAGTGDWQHEKTITLSDRHWSMHAAPEGCLILCGLATGWFRMPENSKESKRQYFAVEPITSLVERLCVFDPIINGRVFPYASFPPSFSLPSI